MGRQGRRHNQLLHDLEESRGSWKLKEKAQIEFCSDFAFEESVGLLQDRI
jgi:hypothetical protein